jgi:aminoglycoside 6'-N-acetyltransferase I
MDDSIHIRPYRSNDWAEWLRMGRALFPDDDIENDIAEMRGFLERADGQVIVAERASGLLAGYVEVGARSVADGCVTSPVGYIEALWVDADVRRRGIARRLLSAAEEWSAAQGYREMGSDVEIDNDVSHETHKRSGYSEVSKVITYRKKLG